MGLSIKEHLHDVGDYYFSFEKSQYQYTKPSNQELNMQVNQKLIAMYNDYPRVSNPNNEGLEYFAYAIIHYFKSIVPILNIKEIERLLNLILLSVKMNPKIVLETKRISNFKRDRRFKTGYRDESTYYKVKKVYPEDINPYWTLIDSEKRRNKIFFVVLLFGHLFLNFLFFLIIPAFFFVNMIFYFVGLIKSLNRIKINALGVDFYRFSPPPLKTG